MRVFRVLPALLGSASLLLFLSGCPGEPEQLPPRPGGQQIEFGPCLWSTDHEHEQSCMPGVRSRLSEDASLVGCLVVQGSGGIAALRVDFDGDELCPSPSNRVRDLGDDRELFFSFHLFEGDAPALERCLDGARPALADCVSEEGCILRLLSEPGDHNLIRDYSPSLDAVPSGCPEALQQPNGHSVDGGVLPPGAHDAEPPSGSPGDSFATFVIDFGWRRYGACNIQWADDAPPPEQCDQADNDCDGVVDEDSPEGEVCEDSVVGDADVNDAGVDESDMGSPACEGELVGDVCPEPVDYTHQLIPHIDYSGACENQLCLRVKRQDENGNALPDLYAVPFEGDVCVFDDETGWLQIGDNGDGTVCRLRLEDPSIARILRNDEAPFRIDAQFVPLQPCGGQTAYVWWVDDDHPALRCARPIDADVGAELGSFIVVALDVLDEGNGNLRASVGDIPAVGSPFRAIVGYVPGEGLEVGSDPDALETLPIARHISPSPNGVVGFGGDSRADRVLSLQFHRWTLNGIDPGVQP